MPIYCPLAELLDLPFSDVSILNCGYTDYDENGRPLPPWNKGKKGLQDNPYKGVKGRYDDKTLMKISKRTKKGMKNLSIEMKQKMREKNKKNGEKCWLYNSEGIHKRVDKENLNEFIAKGWKRGRLLNRDPHNGRILKI